MTNVAASAISQYNAVCIPNSNIATNATTARVADTKRVGFAQVSIASGDYGWVQIKGTATITPALTAGADGNALTPVGATDGTLDVSALVTDAICAYAIDASAKIIKCDFPY